MAFKKGQSGNPRGKKPGTRNKATIAALELLEGDLEDISKVCVEKAKGGDLTACKLILDKIIPRSREQVIDLELPKVTKAAEIPKALMATFEAVARGKITPGQGQALASMLESYRKSIEVTEFMAWMAAVEKRLTKLEDKQLI